MSGTETEGFADEPMPGMPEPAPSASETGPVQRLREIADHDIGGNNPALADVVNEIASVLEADMAGRKSLLPTLALVRREDLQAFFAGIGGRMFLYEGSGAGDAEHRLREAAEYPSLAEASEALLPSPDEPPLPDGEYARVEIMGHDSHTGWVTDGTRGGAPVMVISDWDGHVIAEVPGTSLYRFVPLPTPLKRPDAEPQRALPRGGFGYEADDYDERPF